MEKSQIKNWITRYNREQARLSAGLPPKRRDRPRKDAPPANIREYQQEFNRLKYDNAMAENFFHKPATLDEARDRIDRYIHFYKHERIQYKTEVVPLTLCHST